MPDHFKSSDYLFGLWKPHMEKFMLWNEYSGASGDSAAAATLKKMAPSWSWVTSVGRVEYYDNTFEPKTEICTAVIRVEQEEPITFQTNVFGAGSCTLTLFGFCIPVQQEPVHRQSRMESPQEGYYQPFLFPGRYAVEAERIFGPPYIDMTPDDPADKTVYDRVTHFAPLARSPTRPDDDEDRKLQIQGLFLEMVAGPGEEEEPYSWEHEGVDHDVRFEGTLKRVSHGNDALSLVSLDRVTREDYFGELRAFKLV